MPRDDLSIDFVKRMPAAEALDPAIILDDWINRVQNLPEEIRFLHDEIADKDRQYNDCIKQIEDRDAKIQKWIKANGSHETNPREESMRSHMRDNFARADQLSTEKIALIQKLQIIMDKHLRNLDQHIKMLYDRGEPGFNDPDECPSLIRPSAANHSAPSGRAVNPASHLVGTAITATPLSPIVNSSSSPTAARAGNPQVRSAQSQQHAASAPATPAASMILNRQARESSAGPGSGAPKRGPRSNTGLGSLPTTSSGLARHSSLGPGTPRGTPGTGPGSTVRAGSAGPRSSSTKASSVAGARKGTPGAANRKKGSIVNGNKSSLSRVKKAGSRNSPASTADSELSDAESGSGDDGERSRADRASGTPVRDNKDGDGDDSMLDLDDDEAGDDKKYCTCQNVSFGDMVACDNEDCPYEWFHWSCVGLKSEPNGTWFCPVCTENMEKEKLQQKKK
ncbi:Chromatin modification-related protein YNG2 [Colletotrichum chlorophyti]|uniref:Chromatin modification-related protein n=1 Tax=Colletotrichum chlorophyti TaxID=708187 RepID=A0A1Q8S0X2_9PEZI|nr:Chromatin modification-related protein YNG2 [Colletotrichum chlorophyti]